MKIKFEEKNKIREELSDLCVYFGISRVQKENRLNKELKIDGEFSFKEVGCYECNGFNHDCPHYFSPLREYERVLDKGTF